jgi:hypothetical protein
MTSIGLCVVVAVDRRRPRCEVQTLAGIGRQAAGGLSMFDMKR